MRKKFLAMLLAVVMAASLLPGTAFAAGTGLTQAQNAKISLSLQYEFAGSATKWYAEAAFRASPVVVDLDGDHKLEVLNASYGLYVMDAATGETKWRVNVGKDRTTEFDYHLNPGNGMVYSAVKVEDIDGDGRNEIVIGYANGIISVLDDQGFFKDGWPQQPDIPGGVRSLVVADLDGDEKMEIIVGLATEKSNPMSVWVYHCDGTVADGWPQLDAARSGGSYELGDLEHTSTTAYNYAIYGDGISIGDLTGDGVPEIIVPTDAQYINAFYANGSLVKASDIYSDDYGSRMWGKIPLYEDYDEEIAHINEGWGYNDDLGSRKKTHRAELGFAGTVWTDVDGNGTYELVVTALMMDRTTSATKGNNVATLADAQYMTVFILNADRSRYTNEELGFDWTSAPNELTSNIRTHLKPDDKVSLCGNVFSEPVCSDLDGDGYQEILFNSFDGRVHCFSLDKSEWYFELPKSTSTVYEYATPVVCQDLDGDGTQEVIFASWTDSESRKKTGVKGALYVLSCEGKLLAKTDLPDAYDPSLDNGVMAAPAVEDIDGDGKYEILLNTRYWGLCAYEITVNQPGVAKTPFTDVPAGQYYTSPVVWAAARGIVEGTGATTFSPKDTCTHIDILTMLWRAAGRPISDVTAPVEAGSGSPDYRLAVNWAWEMGMIDENFQRKAPCTRSDAVMYIWQAKDSIPPVKPSSFTDVPADSRFADAVSWAVENGVTNGTDDIKNTFSPNKTCERRDIVSFLYRAYKLNA